MYSIHRKNNIFSILKANFYLAFQDAIKAIRLNSKSVNKSSHLLLQMMQDNLAMWSSKHSKDSGIDFMPETTESKKDVDLAETKKLSIRRNISSLAALL